MEFKLQSDRFGKTKIFADGKELERILEYHICQKEITIKFDADSIKCEFVKCFSGKERDERKSQGTTEEKVADYLIKRAEAGDDEAFMLLIRLLKTRRQP